MEPKLHAGSRPSPRQLAQLGVVAVEGGVGGVDGLQGVGEVGKVPGGVGGGERATWGVDEGGEQGLHTSTPRSTPSTVHQALPLALDFAASPLRNSAPYPQACKEVLGRTTVVGPLIRLVPPPLPRCAYLDRPYWPHACLMA